jgi:hypothetical protein
MKTQLCDDLPVIRIDAPEIYADPEFKQWFFAHKSWNDPDNAKDPTRTLATWHYYGGPEEFGEDSDIFMLVEMMAGEGTSSEETMPEHCWDKLMEAAASIVGLGFKEVIIWLTNTPASDNECQRCNNKLNDGLCCDETCPFSEHQQTCPAGWEGHPKHATGPCNCQESQ